MDRIDTKRCRDGLVPRREPYWYKLSRGRHLGLRKLVSNAPGIWIAKFRGDAGERLQKTLGERTESFGFDEAKLAAEACFHDWQFGVLNNGHGDGPVTTPYSEMAYQPPNRGAIEGGGQSHTDSLEGRAQSSRVTAPGWSKRRPGVVLGAAIQGCTAAPRSLSRHRERRKLPEKSSGALATRHPRRGCDSDRLPRW